MSVSQADGRAARGMTFYAGMALALAVTVLVGFGPTFYLKPFMASPALVGLTALHGFVFTAWVALFIAQTQLVARGRTDMHMRLGAAGAVLAALMLVVGLLTAIDAARRGAVPPGAPPPLVFLAVPFFAIVEFAVLVGLALGLRRDSATHKRLMLLAAITITGAAVARLPIGFAGTPPGFFALTDLFIVAAAVHDWRTRGRVHPAYVWGGLSLIALQPLQLMFAGTGVWLGFAKWLMG